MSVGIYRYLDTNPTQGSGFVDRRSANFWRYLRYSNILFRFYEKNGEVQNLKFFFKNLMRLLIKIGQVIDMSKSNS